MEETPVPRKHMTFEQAEGLEPLPRQLEAKEVSNELRSFLWLLLHQHIRASAKPDEWGKIFIVDPWESILFSHFIIREHGMADEFSRQLAPHISTVKGIMRDGHYGRIFGFLQFVLRHPQCPANFSEAINLALERARAAYRVVDGDTIMPFATSAEIEAVNHAFAETARAEFNGARQHLRDAASALTGGKWAASIRESVHAVEAVARTLDPKATTLTPALTKLEKAGHIHSALQKGFSALYGFTSDEQGIRHALLDKGEADVDEVDALYMFGACAAFVSYLIGKGRAGSLISS